MKQKKIGDVLYIFDITPYEITEDTNAATICIQPELVDAYKTLNASLVSKIMPYNYHTVRVSVPEWAPYAEGPEVETYNFTSYSPQDVEWDQGTVQTTGKVVNGNYEVVVLTSTHEEFVNQKFYVQPDAEADGTTKYPLYDENGASVGIKVTITESE